MKNYWAIILAAGQSSRLQEQGLKTKKQFLTWKGLPLFFHSLVKLANFPKIRGVVLVFPESELSLWQERALNLAFEQGLNLALRFAAGGRLRQDSVFNGLQQLPEECDWVLVHDGARPFFSLQLVSRLFDRAESQPELAGVIPALKSKDTLKEVEANKVKKTLDRDKILRIQTPQLFSFSILKQAHLKAREEGLVGTDDSALVEALGREVGVVEGEEENLKITTQDDLKMLKKEKKVIYKNGFGYDVHRYGGDKPLILGGIPISEKIKVTAHSDGDVLFHALTDALLGALGEEDIGTFFPDTEDVYANMPSSIFFREALLLALKKNFQLVHLDLTIVAQIPKIAPFKRQIKKNLMGLTGLGEEDIALKATTEEGLGFTGAKEGIKVYALVTVKKEEEVENEDL